LQANSLEIEAARSPSRTVLGGRVCTVRLLSVFTRAKVMLKLPCSANRRWSCWQGVEEVLLTLRQRASLLTGTRRSGGGSLAKEDPG